jgi:hypothetical protein
VQPRLENRPGQKALFGQLHELQSKRHHWKNYKFIVYLPFSNKYISTIVFIVFVITLPTRVEIYYLQYNCLFYIIYSYRTIIGFVGFVANLLNRPTDGATVSVRKKLLIVRLWGPKKMCLIKTILFLT